MNLEQTILEMTKESQNLTVEWIFNAIDKVIENEHKIYDETTKALNEIYGDSNSREKTYAHPSVMARVIHELVGEQAFKIGTYFRQRGSRRGLREEIVLNTVEKDYDAKRLNLKNKILKLAKDEEITKISEITIEQDGKFGCIATLESGDKINIETITAGGWNIQKFHFRGLAKRVKA